VPQLVVHLPVVVYLGRLVVVAGARIRLDVGNGGILRVGEFQDRERPQQARMRPCPERQDSEIDGAITGQFPEPVVLTLQNGRLSHLQSQDSLP
jgi:hypothetical protein